MKQGFTCKHMNWKLKCSDGTLYTGCTIDHDERIKRHQKGENTYTKFRLPILLISYIAFSNKYKA